MKNYPTWKWIIVLVSVSLAIIFSIPTFLYKEDSGNWFLNNKINLGLDLQGGSYLLLEVESEVLINEELENINDIVRKISRTEKSKILNIEIKKEEILFNFSDTNNLEKIREQLLSQYRDLNISLKDNILKLKVSENSMLFFI